MRLIDADILEMRLASLPEMWTSWNHWKRARVIIEDMTKVDPVKHAHWTIKKYRLMSWWECSNCNSRERVISRYCPECGAKMDYEKPYEGDK